MLTTVCSGFQSGTDIAGIIAAYDSGLNTTGYIPKGYKTLDGPKPQYKKYGAIEHSSSGYKERTWDNVFHVKTKEVNRFLYEIHAITLIHDWIRQKHLQTLNIAGNSEQTAPGIYIQVYNFLMKVFDEYKIKRNDLVQKGSLVI